jgi:hypothetical protein
MYTSAFYKMDGSKCMLQAEQLCFSLFLQQEAASGAQQQQQQQQHTGSSGLGELSQSDLTGLVSSLDEDAEEDLFKQLGDSTFELDNFFTDFEDKVNVVHMATEKIQSSHNMDEGSQKYKHTVC